MAVTGELEFCAQFLKEPIIAITGTNGKNHHPPTDPPLFCAISGVKTWVGGNFGEPISEYLIRDQKADVLILEVSSFMLEHVQKFIRRTSSS